MYTVDFATNESVFVFTKWLVWASTSAVFYWEDIIPVLFSTKAFTAKIPGVLKAIEDYQQQQQNQCNLR